MRKEGWKATVHEEVNKGEKCESEQDARIALLGHFSSKSTNEAIILLTEAIGFFTFLGWILPTNVFCRDYLVIVALGFFAYLVSYTFGRLIFWGEQANAILSVKMLKEDEEQKKIGDYKAGLGLPEPVKLDDGKEYSLDLLPTCLDRLSFACIVYFYARRQSGKSLLVKGYFFLQSRKWIFSVIAGTTVVLIIQILRQNNYLII